MPKPFVKLTIDEFEQLCANFDFKRAIDSVHMHHTWRPNRAQYRGLASINAMWNHHTQTNGWSDIAQHITIAPDGSIWSGRNWNIPPASAQGYNGNTKVGPFMFEMIGDFDSGKDDFHQPPDQKQSTIRVVAALLDRFKLPISALRFHNHMTNKKSCPGTSIDYQAFCNDVTQHLKAGGPPKAAARRSGGKASAPSASVVQALGILGEEVEIDLDLPEFSAEHVPGLPEGFATRGIGEEGLSFEPRAHIVNLRDGRLSSSGALATTIADLDEIVDTHLPAAMEEAREAMRPLRIMFFAHGGLGKEADKLKDAMTAVQWWLDNGIYPIFFVWETGLLETLGQMIERETKGVWGKVTDAFGGRRGLDDFIADHASDPAVEALARSIGGVAIWGGMKSSALRASEKNSGGAWELASRLGPFLKKAANAKKAGQPEIELHCVGHSAGSIFMAHFMEMACGVIGQSYHGKPLFRTLHHLAPAIRVDLFKDKVEPLLGTGIGHLTCYTMTDKSEREDTCAKVYKKSLLYLIHHGLEPERRCPILGLQASIRGDGTLARLFEPSRPSHAEVIWSPVEGGPRHSSKSLKHGGFDTDPHTMNSVCRRIMGNDGINPFPAEKTRSISSYTPDEASDEQVAIGILTQRALSLRERPAMEAPAIMIPAAANGPAIIPRPGSRRRALCIGIDNYPDFNDRLSGCVRDAYSWQDFLGSQGFNVGLLLNEQASYDGIRGALTKLVEGSRAGDVIAVHISSHGTHVEDVNGDEEDDAKDEALCCYDFREGRLFLDDDIGLILDRVPDGVNFSFFVDTCHSGTMTRVVANGDNPLPPGSRARFVPPTEELNEKNRAFRLGKGRGGNGTSKGNSGNGGGGSPYESAREVLFAAALPTQYANEIGGSGVFTSTAMRVLANGVNGLSNEDFAKAVLRDFPREFSRVQEPRIYCSSAAGARPLLAPFA